MMLNRHKKQNRSFFWGIAAGAAAGLWAANKMMNRTNTMEEENQTEQHHEQHENHFNPVGDLTDLEGKQKEALFDAFLHGSKEDLVSKAQEYQS